MHLRRSGERSFFYWTMNASCQLTPSACFLLPFYRVFDFSYSSLPLLVWEHKRIGM